MTTSTLTRQCATADCTASATGKSKYCTPHKQQAREAWKARVQEDSAAREEKKAAHADLFARAHAAGMAAGTAVSPEPMVVVEREHPLDDSSPVVAAWNVAGGVCGFAWIVVRPGNSSFARWLVSTGRGRSSYQGGIHVRVGEFGQSLEMKEAYARAFAGVLAEAGIKAYPMSRMD